MVQAKTAVIPDGYIIRKLATFERVQHSPQALLNAFTDNIQKSIKFANDVVRYADVTFAQRMLSLLEKLPAGYLSFFLMEVDSEQNTMGHVIVTSEHYVELLPAFQQCRDKLQPAAAQRLATLQNSLGQTIDDLMALHDDSQQLPKKAFVRLSPIKQLGLADMPGEDSVSRQSSSLKKASKVLLRREGFFPRVPPEGHSLDVALRVGSLPGAGQRVTLKPIREEQNNLPDASDQTVSEEGVGHLAYT